MGEGYQGGTYFVEAVQGKQRKAILVIKQN